MSCNIEDLCFECHKFVSFFDVQGFVAPDSCVGYNVCINCSCTVFKPVNHIELRKSLEQDARSCERNMIEKIEKKVQELDNKPEFPLIYDYAVDIETSLDAQKYVFLLKGTGFISKSELPDTPNSCHGETLPLVLMARTRQ